MDKNLKQLVRMLREETCPQRVIEEVDRRRAAAARVPGRFSYAFAGAFAVLAILSIILVRPLPQDGSKSQPSAQVSDKKQESLRVAREAEGSLGYIGWILLNTSANSGKIILKGTVAPVQNSLQTVKTKIKNQL